MTESAACVGAPDGLMMHSGIVEHSPFGLTPDSGVPQAHGPEQAEELLGLIVDSLRALHSAVPAAEHHLPQPQHQSRGTASAASGSAASQPSQQQEAAGGRQGAGLAEAGIRRRPQSAKKMAKVLEHAPLAYQGEILALVPRLVDAAEHPEAAEVLLQRMRMPEAQPMMQLPVRPSPPSWSAPFAAPPISCSSIASRGFCLGWDCPDVGVLCWGRGAALVAVS